MGKGFIWVGVFLLFAGVRRVFIRYSTEWLRKQKSTVRTDETCQSLKPTTCNINLENNMHYLSTCCLVSVTLDESIRLKGFP